MIFVGLLLLTAMGGGPVDEADAANLAFTRCLFAKSRSASAARLTVDAFEEKLAAACRAEQRSVERATSRVLTLRGEANASASAHEVADGVRRQIVDTYRRTIELEPEIRRVAEMCRAHPEQCRE